MTEHLAPIFDIQTRRRIHPELSHDDITPEEHAQLQWKYEAHTTLAEHHWRMAEPYARRLGYLGIERGLDEGQGQLPLMNLIKGEE